MAQQRQIGLDIIRACAIIFVLSVHFFLNTGFYQDFIIGKSMYVEVFLRMSFLICVPLFLLLTGYLQMYKEFNRAYVKKVIPIVVIYFVYAILSVIVRIFYLHEEKEISKWIGEVLGFSADGYAWYINMYIGLFLMSPFLNNIYRNLKTKTEKKWLILVFLFITAVPAFLNGKLNGALYFPDYWMIMYPVTYYFIGCYIREYQPKIPKIKGIMLFFLIICVETWIEIYQAKGGVFTTSVGLYGSILVTLQAVIFFLLLYNNTTLQRKWIVSVISAISFLSLDIYLMSYITDIFVYRHLFHPYLNSARHEIILFIPTVFTTFILSFFVAFVRHKLIRVR